ncbi:hypothetical protein N7495_007292 [Penicillium taxi]|uniref:uncharacterized protein n=1 Tax=Penicillium taxi TaxID=168475 RepID=UPI002545AF2D|nr:uncharacterized protein N7495_007292 [Penicillium taxi]KAJ5895601.1 hypothetical protein N7495_007292 [Penicillium taxi]
MSIETPLITVYKEINGSIIDIHGGAFMLGHSRMISMSQVDDCLARGWIVLAPNHRLCPGVNLLEGPMQDIRSLLAWVYEGHLDNFLSEQAQPFRADLDNVAAFGTSSGGHLALSLGFDTPKTPKAILSLYGSVHFTDPFWKQPLPHVSAKLPPLDPAFLERVYDEVPIPTDSSVSLEGQSESGLSKGPDFSRPRDAFAFTQIAAGTVLSAVYPESRTTDPDMRLVDPVQNISGTFPPTYVVHGMADTMVPIWLSRILLERLKAAGVESGMTEVPGEEHTFAAMMKVGSKTWWLQRKGFDFLERFIGRGPL